MEKLDSYKLDRWPFADFEYVSDLIEFDEPLLVHYKRENRHALYYWVEGDNSFNRWLCFELTTNELYNYLHRFTSLFDLIVKKTNEPFFTVDIDDNLVYHNFQMFIGHLIPEKYLPDQDSYFLDEMASFYEVMFQTLQKDDYTELISERSIDLKIAARTTEHRETLSLTGVQDFLRRIDESYKAYRGWMFFDTYKSQITNPDTLIKAGRKFVASAEPRIAHVELHSFQITLASDVIVDQSYEYSELRQTILQRYKEDVLDLDLNDDQVVDELISRFDDLTRKSIFEPLIKVINNNEYDLTLIDKRENLSKQYEKIVHENKKRLIPKIEKVEPSAQQKVLVTITLELDANTPLDSITKRDLAQSTLFTKIGQEISTEFQRIGDDELDIIFQKPVSINYQIRGEHKLVIFDPLDIVVQGREKEEVLSNFVSEFMSIIRRDYLSKQPKSKKNKEYLDSVIVDVVEKR